MSWRHRQKLNRIIFLTVRIAEPHSLQRSRLLFCRNSQSLGVDSGREGPYVQYGSQFVDLHEQNMVCQEGFTAIRTGIDAVCEQSKS